MGGGTDEAAVGASDHLALALLDCGLRMFRVWRKHTSPLSKRFQIEEIIAQSPLGVVFYATDSHSGQTVALRRFFPFGADSEGLSAADQTVYHMVLGRLLGVSHPALRAVVAGGCDPVDGMPFVATEWVAGHLLEEVLKPGKLKPAQAVLLLVSVLDVSGLLSQALGHEAVWVDTRLSSIVIGDAASGRGATFWISTLRWLDGGAPAEGLQPVVRLAEDLLGWCGRIPGDRAADGLRRWLRWLRANAPSAGIGEAQARLVALLAEVERSAAPGGRAEPAAARSGYFRLLIAGVAALAVVAAAGWRLSHRQQPRRLPPPTAMGGEQAQGEMPDSTVPPRGAVAPAAKAPSVLAAATGVALDLPQAAAGLRPPPVPKPRSSIDGRNLPVFAAGQTAELMATRNREVIVEGVLVEVVAARSGNHLYLEFSKPGPPYLARGILFVEHRGQMEAKAALDTWVGKRVRLVGKVDVERFRDGMSSVARPKIPLRGPDGVELIE